MSMLEQELTQQYNKFTEKVIEFVTVATALAMMAFASMGALDAIFRNPRRQSTHIYLHAEING